MSFHSPPIPYFSLLLHILFLQAPLFQGCKCSLGPGGITTQLLTTELWKNIHFESGKPDVPSPSLLSSALFFGVGFGFALWLRAVPSYVLSFLCASMLGCNAHPAVNTIQFGILWSCGRWKTIWEAEENAVIWVVCGDQRLLCLLLSENHRSTEGEGEHSLGRK